VRWSFGQPAEPTPDDLEPPGDDVVDPAGEPAAPAEDVPWDTEEARAYGDVVARRFHVVRVPWADVRAGWRSGSDRLASFAAWLERAAGTSDRVAPRLDVREVDAPGGVRRALESCQKPFQLWNVERIEAVETFALKPVTPLRVGQAAQLSEEQRPPRKIDKATRTLVDLLEERAFRALMDEKNRAQQARIWIDPLPFGVAEEEPGPRARVISVEELMAMQGGGDETPRRGPPPAQRRGPASAPPAGGFSFDQPDDDDDDDDDRGPPRGGFAFDQPDDD
jgi:hypothetical protein